VAQLRLLDPVPYGAEFFGLLRRYHGVLVPSVSDEQPRILYDAFAQAVPALASDTPGHRAAVIPGETGFRFAPGDVAALLAVLVEVHERPDALRAMGMTARDRAVGSTHRAMHLTRAKALVDVLCDPLPTED
jgi:glycosyltransferase involved in cell wall biosynthesis